MEGTEMKKGEGRKRDGGAGGEGRERERDKAGRKEE